jgi:hypothetical protein
MINIVSYKKMAGLFTSVIALLRSYRTSHLC